MAARRWTSEQKQRQAALIRQWAPWTLSTGPQSVRGKQKASRNAYRGSLRSEMRALAKKVNELLRAQADLIRGR